MTRLYAPPSYEVVIGMNEDPPPYQAVADGFETDSENDDSLIEDHAIQNSNYASVSLPSNPKNSDIVTTNIQVTSALVTCDIEGNNICTTDVCETEKPVCNGGKAFEEMTNYKPLPCNGSESSLRKVTIIDHDTNEIEVLEHHSSNEDVTYCNGHINNGSLRNGKLANGGSHVTGNGITQADKRSSYSKVLYKRSPSRREADTIDYVDSD